MKRGSALLLVVVITAVFMLLAVILTKMVYNNYLTNHCFLRREQAFWLAAAGLEKGKFLISHQPNWYTDLPHVPEDDLGWLKFAAVGQVEHFGGGWFKIVREMGKAKIYAVGGRGEAVVVLKQENMRWQEL